MHQVAHLVIDKRLLEDLAVPVLLSRLRGPIRESFSSVVIQVLGNELVTMLHQDISQISFAESFSESFFASPEHLVREPTLEGASQNVLFKLHRHQFISWWQSAY